MSDQAPKAKKKNLKVELKKMVKTFSIPNCQLKLTTKNTYDLLGGYLIKNVASNKISILNPNSVNVEHITKLNDLKAELQDFCELYEKDDQELETDCYFKDNKRLYRKNDKFFPLDVFDLETNSNSKLELENKENIDYLLVFSYFRTPEDDIKIIDDIMKNIIDQKRENIKITYILCPEIDQVVEDADLEEEDLEEDEKDDKTSKTDFKLLLENSLKNIISYSNSEEFKKRYNNKKINFYYMDNLSEKMLDLNEVIDLYNLMESNYVFYVVNHQSTIINIVKEVNQIFEIKEEVLNSKTENTKENSTTISEKEVNSIDKKLNTLKFDELNKSNYEFINYSLFYKTVFHINDKNMEKKSDNFPCIRFFLPKSHESIHKEICGVLEEKKVFEKFDIKGVILDTNETVSEFIRFFKKECEKEGIKITPNDIELTFVKKILNEDRKKKINFKVLLKEENNNKDYFLKMGRVKETIAKKYEEKHSKFQIFYKINVIQNFKEGEKFVKIPALISYNKNQEVDLKFPEGKIFIINFFSVIFDDKNCQIKMQNEMLKKNINKWENKVVISAITNYPKIKLDSYIKNNQINLIDFYVEQNELPCFDYLYEKKEKFPEIIIVNRLGTIVYTGNIDEYVQLESFIETLLDSNEDLILNSDKFFIRNPLKSNLNLSLTGGMLKSLGKSFDKFYYDNIYEKCEYDYKFKFVLEKKIKFDENFNRVGKELKRINLEGFLFENEKKTLDNYISKEVYSSLSQDFFTPNITLMKEEILNLKKVCDKCQTKLEKKNYYACFWCKISFCEECGEVKDMTKIGPERYSHNHNLIFINSKIHAKVIKLETHKLGHNLFEKVQNIDFDLTEKFSDCNGCRKYIKKGYRFTCLNCVPGYREEGYNDICEKCFTVLKNPGHKKYKQTLVNLREFEHDINTHVLLRINYSKTYFDF